MPPQIAKHLGEALETDETLFAAVVAATERQRDDEARIEILARETAYRAAFKPHLRTETTRAIPEPVFIVALVGAARLRHVALPDAAWRVSAEERNRLVKDAIRDHHRAHGGWVPAFGAIVGYSLVTMAGYLVDFGFPYDLNDDPVGPLRPATRLGEAVLGTERGDRRLTGLLKNSPIITMRLRGDQ
jgi:hypothetical protein